VGIHPRLEANVRARAPNTNPSSDVAFQSADQTSLLVSSLTCGDSPLGMRAKLHVRQRAGKRDARTDGNSHRVPFAPIGETPLEVSSLFALTIPLYSDDAENLAYGEKVHCTAKIREMPVFV